MANVYKSVDPTGDPNKFNIDELRNFVHEHLQQKINHGELALAGFNMENAEVFKEEIEIYEYAMLEGMVNAIFMCGFEVDGIDG